MQGEDIQVAVGRNRLGRSQLLILQKNANSTVIGANVAANNGIVHAINRVLLPPSLQVNTIISAGKSILCAGEFHPLRRYKSHPFCR
jgi:hypothetical protein